MRRFKLPLSGDCLSAVALAKAGRSYTILVKNLVGLRRKSEILLGEFNNG